MAIAAQIAVPAGLIAVLLASFAQGQHVNATCEVGYPPILSFHVHVVFWGSNATSTAKALQLRSDLISEFEIPHDCDKLGYSPYQPVEEIPCSIEPHMTPRDPFPTARFRLSLPSVEWQGRVTAWLLQHRGDLDVFVHPLTGCQLKDHTIWAMWLGRQWELSLSEFTCNYPGCSK